MVLINSSLDLLYLHLLGEITRIVVKQVELIRQIKKEQILLRLISHIEVICIFILAPKDPRLV